MGHLTVDYLLQKEAHIRSVGSKLQVVDLSLYIMADTSGLHQSTW